MPLRIVNHNLQQWAWKLTHLSPEIHTLSAIVHSELFAEISSNVTMLPVLPHNLPTLPPVGTFTDHSLLLLELIFSFSDPVNLGPTSIYDILNMSLDNSLVCTSASLTSCVNQTLCCCDKIYERNNLRRGGSLVHGFRHFAYSHWLH